MSGKLDDFDKAAEALAKSKTDYEALLAKLEPRIAKAATATVEELKKAQESIASRRSSIGSKLSAMSGLAGRSERSIRRPPRT